MAKMGRPPIDFDWHKLDNILKIGASLIDCVEIMGCGKDTIIRRIKEAHGITFAKYRDQKMAHTRLTVIQRAMELVKKGNVVMTIFVLKNMCGWSDQVPLFATDDQDELEFTE